MRRPIREAILIAFAVAIPAAAQADWADHATPFDQKRLSRLDASRSRGLSESNGRGLGDARAIRETMDAAPGGGGNLTGNWRCRTIKLGGMTSYVVYSWYRCRISNAGGHLVFEKVSGTQKMAGNLYPDGDGYVYLGASWTKGETPHRYSGNEPSAGAFATPDDQAGKLFATGPGRARIEMPYPVQESTFDVIELRR